VGYRIGSIEVRKNGKGPPGVAGLFVWGVSGPFIAKNPRFISGGELTVRAHSYADRYVDAVDCIMNTPLIPEQDAMKKLKEAVSREKAVLCPHFMMLAMYFWNKYQIPNHPIDQSGMLYHYTDAAGLLGMVSTNRLWATDVSFLNDPSEGQLFPKNIIDFMRKKSGGLTKIEQEIVDKIADCLGNGLEVDRSFSVSFCGNGDLLSQWRAYGSFGSGYAVGMQLAGKPHPQLGNLIEVQYGLEGMQAVALDLLSIYVEANPKWKLELCNEAAKAIRYLSLAFKDESYCEEKETRIIAKASNKDNDMFKFEAPLNFRARGSDIVPYINLAIDLNLQLSDENPPPLPIRRIVIGPGVDYYRNRSSLEQLLTSHGYEGVEIAPSTIPFRP